MFLLPKGTFPHQGERQIGDTYIWIGLLCINDNNIVNVIKGNLIIKKDWIRQARLDHIIHLLQCSSAIISITVL